MGGSEVVLGGSRQFWVDITDSVKFWMDLGLFKVVPGGFKSEKNFKDADLVATLFFLLLGGSPKYSIRDAALLPLATFCGDSRRFCVDFRWSCGSSSVRWFSW